MKTITVLVPFTKNIMKPETGSETAILLVPDGMDPDSANTTFLLAAQSQKLAADMNEGIRQATWWITNDPLEVEKRGEGDRCATCRAGVDQALAHLKEFPDKPVAVGLLSWCAL